MDIPENAQRLLKWETKAFAFLGLALTDGSPQVTPIWFDWDGTHVIINTARGRVKDKALKRRAKVALAIPDPDDLYKYIQIKGSVVDETEEGGFEMICRLNDKYHGNPNYPKVPGQVRVTYKILPEKVFTNIK
jgi:PPOX class probable F420-dependent enzyme